MFLEAALLQGMIPYGFGGCKEFLIGVELYEQMLCVLMRIGVNGVILANSEEGILFFVKLSLWLLVILVLGWLTEIIVVVLI